MLISRNVRPAAAAAFKKAAPMAMAACLVATLGVGLGACQLFAVPTEEIQTFADAWGEVSKTNDQLLHQFEMDTAAQAPAADRSAGTVARYPPPLPALVLVDQPAASQEDIIARANAVEVVDRYNEILLAIRDNRPLTQTQHLAQSLGNLLLTGLQAASGAVGVPPGVLQPIVSTIQRARTRAEIVRALRMAKISDEAYRLLVASQGNAASPAAQELAQLPEDRVACFSAAEPTCVSLIVFTLDLMRADADDFYAARETVVLQQRAEITSDLARLNVGLMRFLRPRRPPEPGTEFARSWSRQQAAYNQILQPFGVGPVSFPNDSTGPSYDQAAEDFVANVLVAAAALDEKDVALAAGLTEYRDATLRYRDVLLPSTAEYFEQIEAALESAPDLLGVSEADSDTIIPLAEGLIDGSTDVRVLLRAAVGLT